MDDDTCIIYQTVTIFCGLFNIGDVQEASRETSEAK